MFTFETTDQKEVRRFRIAQFNGRIATARSGGATVTGHVRSILEDKSSAHHMGHHDHSGSSQDRQRAPAAGASHPDLCGRPLLKLWKP